MTIDEILHSTDVSLALRADEKNAAIEEVLSLLRGDERVSNWEELRNAVIARDAPPIEHEGRVICIAHGRTRAVSELVVAAGRSDAGIFCPETKLRVNLLFVVGIPAAVDSEYLRLVGSIARVCSDSRQMTELLSAPDADAFVECLTAGSARL